MRGWIFVKTGVNYRIVLLSVLSLFFILNSCYAAENGLVAHYKFKTDFNDSSGNGFNGSIVGAVSLAKDDVVGKHAVFNGGYIHIPNGSGLQLQNNFTLSVWVLVDSAKSGNKAQSIFSKMNDAGTHNIVHAFTRGAFGARMDVLFGKAGNVLVTGGPYDNYGMGNNWTHLSFSCDGSKLRLYVNGVLKGSSRDIPAGMSIVPSNGKVRIGTGNDTSNQGLFFMGKMTDFRLYNRTLGLDEIQSLHQAGANSAD